VRVTPEERARVTEALESALKFGQGKVNIYEGQTRDGPGSVPDLFESRLHGALTHHRDEVSPVLG